MSSVPVSSTSRGPAPHYAPDGGWWWDGARWHELAPGELPPAPARPESPSGAKRSARWRVAALRPGRSFVMIAAALVVLVVVASAGGALLLRLRSIDGSAAGPGGVAAFTRLFQSQGYGCNHTFTRPVGIWKCYRSSQGVYVEIGAQVAPDDAVEVTRAIVGAASFARHPRALKSVAYDVYEQMVRVLSDGLDRRQLSSWVRSSYDRGHASFTRLKGLFVQMNPGFAGTILQAVRAGATARDIVGPALAAVDTAALTRIMRGQGLSCGQDQYSITCSRSGFPSRSVDTSVNLDEAGKVKLASVAVSDLTNDPYADVGPQTADLAAILIHQMMPGDAGRQAASWVRPRLDGGRYDTDIAGVALHASPIDGIDNPPRGQFQVILQASYWLNST
jgi:hypothetical protein